jgi:hypothetical protein
VLATNVWLQRKYLFNLPLPGADIFPAGIHIHDNSAP